MIDFYFSYSKATANPRSRENMQGEMTMLLSYGTLVAKWWESNGNKKTTKMFFGIIYSDKS